MLGTIKVALNKSLSNKEDLRNKEGLLRVSEWMLNEEDHQVEEVVEVVVEDLLVQVECSEVFVSRISLV